jgi:hypothetical protein
MVEATLVKTLFHSGDPETSRKAAERLVESGELSRQEGEVYAAILEHCPHDTFTARELADKSDLDYFMIQRRLSGINQIEHTGGRRNGYAVWKRK